MSLTVRNTAQLSRGTGRLSEMVRVVLEQTLPKCASIRAHLRSTYDKAPRSARLFPNQRAQSACYPQPCVARRTQITHARDTCARPRHSAHTHASRAARCALTSHGIALSISARYGAAHADADLKHPYAHVAPHIRKHARCPRDRRRTRRVRCTFVRTCCERVFTPLMPDSDRPSHADVDSTRCTHRVAPRVARRNTHPGRLRHTACTTNRDLPNGHTTRTPWPTFPHEHSAAACR